MSLVFVYGTLKRGFINAPILEDEKFIGPVITKDAKFAIYEVQGRYAFPALVEREDGERIYGELHDVSPECLVELDRLEGVNLKVPLYVRKEITVIDADNNEHSALCYLFCRETSGLKALSKCWPTTQFPKFAMYRKRIHFKQVEEGGPSWSAEVCVIDEKTYENLSPYMPLRELPAWAAENLATLGGVKFSAMTWREILGQSIS